MNALPEILLCAVLPLACLAEWLHSRRSRPLGGLAFGPAAKPAAWTAFVIPLRVLACAGLTWSLATLFVLPAQSRKTSHPQPNEIRHIVLVLDVSPSMKLKDAGTSAEQTRAERVASLLESFFQRVPIDQVRLSVIATYTSAKPVVIDTSDVAVVRNIIADLPLSHAFESGKTDLFSGLAEAARVAQPWPRNSTTLLVLSDGDSVPPTGMPAMPPSINHTVLIGVGDPRTGQFINGHQSRQDAATMKQIAIRLKGAYHDGNQKHLSSDLLRTITALPSDDAFAGVRRREVALGTLAVSSLIFALIPLALHAFGTAYRPGVSRGSHPFSRFSQNSAKRKSVTNLPQNP